MTDDDLGAAAVLAALIMDIGWLAWAPGVGLPAVVVMTCVQARVVWDAIAGGGPPLAHELAFMLWVVASGHWMFAEFYWDGSKPAGFLSFLPQENRGLYPGFLMICGASMLGVFAALTSYLLSWWSTRRAETSTQTALAKRAHEEPPLHVALNGWFAPWLFMETGWVVCDSLLARKAHIGALIVPCVCAGVLAVVLSLDAARCCLVLGWRRQACMCMADFFWVLGNLTWMINDLLYDEHSPWTWWGAMVCFILGAACIFEVLRNREGIRQPLTQS